MVLMEVVVAMSLFFGSAIVILAGLRNSILAARTLRLEARAADLAITLMSEIEMGMLPPEDAGPETYEDVALEGWTWEIVTEDIEQDIQIENAVPMKRVDVIITYEPRAFGYALHRLFVAEDAQGEGQEDVEDPLDPAFGGGGSAPGGFPGGGR